jgi:glyoxylase-like metal-dependent hydrolase (beta-lactamase superfamily II)
MQEVAPGVWAEHGYESGNVGFVVTGVPMMPDAVYHWLYSIRKVTDEPIISLVQTDYDRSRVLSTCLVEARLTAHEAAWEGMHRIYTREKTVQQIVELLGHGGNWQVRMPDITFTEHMVLQKGRQEIHLLHGGGHSEATCMVHLPEHRLMFTGDVVFNDGHPTMEYAETGAWLSALTRLCKLDVDAIVPGHGVVCDREATYPLSDYIRQMRAHVRRCFRTGRSKSETAKVVVPKFLDAFSYRRDDLERVRSRIKGGSDRIYDEYREEAREKDTTKRGKRRTSRDRQRK